MTGFDPNKIDPMKDKQLSDHSLEKIINPTDRIEGFDYENFEIIDISERIEKFLQENKEEGGSLLINELTNGEYLNKRNLNNVMYGLPSYKSDKNSSPFLGSVMRDFGVFYFCAGKNKFAGDIIDNTKPLFIFGKKNKNFKRLMTGIWTDYKKEFFANNDALVTKILENIKYKDSSGENLYDISWGSTTNISSENKTKLANICNEYGIDSRVYELTLEHSIRELLLPYCFLEGLPMQTGEMGGGIDLGRLGYDIHSEKKRLYEFADYTVDLQSGKIIKYKDSEN